MLKIEEQLLSNKAVFLNLTLQERATGLDDIVGDLSSFFNLPVYFWNLSRSNAGRIVLRKRSDIDLANRLKAERIKASDLEEFFPSELVESSMLSLTDSQPIFSPSSTAIGSKSKNLTSSLARRLQDRLPEKHVVHKTQSFVGIIEALIQVYESSETGIFIIENINQLLSSKTLDVFQYEQIKTWLIKLTQKARETKNFYLILLGSSGLEWNFDELAPLVRLPYLNHKEIAKILKDRFAKLQLKDSDKYDLTEKAGHILTGMSKPELNWGIDNITNSLKEDNTVAAYVEGLLKFKQNKLSQLGLSFLPPPEIDTVGGMDILKAYIDNLKILFSCDRQKYNIPQEQGWALVGVPGSGKSLVAKVMQFRLALPMIHIPIDKVKDRGPGYLARILELCEAYAPNIVYIDELDKMFLEGDLEGDAATTLAVFLTWLQEKQASCFVLATLNRLDTLPPELLRSGRFSEVFYVGFPQPNERREIYQLYLEKYDARYKKDLFSNEQWRELIDESIRFTGAEIAAVVKKAYLDKFYERRKAIIKLEKQQFELVDSLKQIIRTGYEEKQKQLPRYRIDVDNLDRQMSKVLTDLVECDDEIDSLYGQLSQLILENAALEKISSSSQKLEHLINKGYQAAIEASASKTIGIENIDGMLSRALVDIGDDSPTQRQRINKLEKFYAHLNEIAKTLNKLETKPLKIDYQSVLDFTTAEIPLFERAVEKVMAIENRARKLCKPVSSKDTSALVDKEPSFWQDMKPTEAVTIINRTRQAEATAEGEHYEPIDSLDEAIDEKDLRDYWGF